MHCSYERFVLKKKILVIKIKIRKFSLLVFMEVSKEEKDIFI